MAFTGAQQLKIRQYLGYPSINRYRDPRLEGAIETVGNDVDASAVVIALLAELATVDENLAADGSIVLSAGLKRADEVEWYPEGSYSGSSGLVAGQIAAGKRLCSRLSQLMGVPLYGDYFGKGGYPGDHYMGIDHQYGGVIKLG